MTTRNSITNRPWDIEEKYELEDIIGTGTYGIVRKCREKSTGTIYAVKTIRKHHIQNLDTLRNEIQILSEVNHPNIIKLQDIFEDEFSINIVTELCTGGELYDRVIEKSTSSKDGGHFHEKDASHIIYNILNAISYCHDVKHIVHRDLKLENFLLLHKGDDSPIKIIDFGLSRYDSNTNNKFGIMKSRVGSPYYVAPEVLTMEYTNKCDIWSIGVITYILLCGFPPFDGNSDYEIIHTVETFQNSNLKFPSPEWDDISTDAKNFVITLLEKDPTKRPSAKDAMNHKWILKHNDVIRTETEEQKQLTQQKEEGEEEDTTMDTIAVSKAIVDDNEPPELISEDENENDKNEVVMTPTSNRGDSKVLSIASQSEKVSESDYETNQFVTPESTPSTVVIPPILPSAPPLHSASFTMTTTTTTTTTTTDTGYGSTTTPPGDINNNNNNEVSLLLSPPTATLLVADGLKQKKFQNFLSNTKLKKALSAILYTLSPSKERKLLDQHIFEHVDANKDGTKVLNDIDTVVKQVGDDFTPTIKGQLLELKDSLPFPDGTSTEFTTSTEFSSAEIIQKKKNDEENNSNNSDSNTNNQNKCNDKEVAVAKSGDHHNHHNNHHHRHRHNGKKKKTKKRFTVQPLVQAAANAELQLKKMKKKIKKKENDSNESSEEFTPNTVLEKENMKEVAKNEG